MPADGTYIIGRAPAAGGGRRGHLRLNHRTVSQRHAELVVLAGTYYLIDLESRNGIWRQRDTGRERLSEGYVDPDEPLWFGEHRTTLRSLLDTAVAA